MAEKSIEECETEIQELTEQLTLSRNMYDELFDQQKQQKESLEIAEGALKEVYDGRSTLEAQRIARDALLKLGVTL